MISVWRAYINKFSNKLFGVVHVPAQGAKKGAVLLSYLTGPFNLLPWERFTDPHTNYWECAQIARLFAERGYAVDIIDFKNKTFTPRKKYRACIDVMQNLARLSPLLPADCKKVLHITSSEPEFQNNAEAVRLKELKERRGITLNPSRLEDTVDNATYADYLEGFGNSAVHATYVKFKKPIFPIPISVSQQFDFPEKKDFGVARTNFLWFGGGGAILKGLDRILEAFVSMPHLTLHIVGPASYEEDFARAYARELSLPNIIRHPRPHLTPKGEMVCGDTTFIEIANRCATLIYPAASEGTSGAVVQAMHAGVITIVTKETGVADDAPIDILKKPSVDEIVAEAKRISDTNPEELRKKALRVWRYAHAHYTKRNFTAAYADFIDNVLLL